MTTSAHQLLAAYEALGAEDQQQFALEILRRVAAAGELSDEGLEESAAQVFRGYDAEESDVSGG
jgi:hypothetical protein